MASQSYQLSTAFSVILLVLSIPIFLLLVAAVVKGLQMLVVLGRRFMEVVAGEPKHAARPAKTVYGDYNSGIPDNLLKEE